MLREPSPVGTLRGDQEHLNDSTLDDSKVPERTEIFQIRNASDFPAFPAGLSFFGSYLQYYVQEILAVGGEAFVSSTSEGDNSGLFIYDPVEKVGTIFTKSSEVFDYFYALKPFNFLFSELKTERENEIYDIYSVELENLAMNHRFVYQISVAGEDSEGIERFMELTHTGINKNWTRIALKNGEKCFFVKFENEIAGVGWLSIVNRIGRLHSLFVKPQFRKIGIAEDILHARLLYLKSKHARSAFSEISRTSPGSSRIALRAGMTVQGQIYQYFRKKPEANV